MNADGSDVIRLTDAPRVDANPAWSPKGDRIAFQRQITGPLQVFSMNPDGSDR
jgi:TolB protein